jgi:hypothetical protein
MAAEPSVLIHEQPNMSFGGGIPTVGKWPSAAKDSCLLTVVPVHRS